MNGLKEMPVTVEERDVDIREEEPNKEEPAASPEVMSMIEGIRDDVNIDKEQIEALRQRIEQLAGALENLPKGTDAVPVQQIEVVHEKGQVDNELLQKYEQRQEALEREISALQKKLNNQTPLYGLFWLLALCVRGWVGVRAESVVLRFLFAGKSMVSGNDKKWAGMKQVLLGRTFAVILVERFRSSASVSAMRQKRRCRFRRQPKVKCVLHVCRSSMNENGDSLHAVFSFAPHAAF